MQYKIASFNICRFQAYSDTTYSKIEHVARIILEEKFDIVAIQEVLSQTVLEMLCRRLGLNWSCYWDTPNSKYGSSISREGYGYLWNNKFKLVTTTTEEGERTFEPRIMNQYKKGALQQRLVRNPYYIRLMPATAASGWFEIRLLNCHIMFSKNAIHEENESIELPSDVAMRRNEQEILCRDVYTTVADKRYGDNMPAYTILLGDYNLNHPLSGKSNSLLIERFVIDTDNGKRDAVVTTQTELTTISTQKMNFVNNYDHFSYYERFGENFKNARRVNTVASHFPSSSNPFEQHKKEISDHVPIAVDFNIRNF